MSRSIRLILGSALLALSTSASSAQIYPLTNGPNGTGDNTVDSRRGFIGGNAVASEREFLYHPERAGNAAAELGVSAAQAGGPSYDDGAPARRPVRHRRGRVPLR